MWRLLLLLGPACLSFPTVNVGTKTSLERQLIGDLEPLTEEEILAASVRAATSQGPAIDSARERALFARRRQLFNRDDVRLLIAAGCAGESAAATLAERGCARPAEFAPRVIQEENEDRAAIIDWALAADPLLTAAGRTAVLAMHRRMLQQQLPAGALYQDDGGLWQRK